MLEKHGMLLSGLSPDGNIVEMVEIPEHPWFIATQAHPELKSRPNRPHPLFKGFVEAALERQAKSVSSLLTYSTFFLCDLTYFCMCRAAHAANSPISRPANTSVG